MMVLKVNVNYFLIALLCFPKFMILILIPILILLILQNPTKQVQEIILSRKITPPLNPVVYFDNRPVKSTRIHKNLGTILD